MHLSVIWIISLGNVFVFSTINNWEVIYPCFFAFNFSSNVLVFAFQHVLTFSIKKKIALVSNVCFKPPITS
jgi:hypothetical protein